MPDSATANSMMWLALGMMLGVLGFQVLREVGSSERGTPAPPTLSVRSVAPAASLLASLAAPPALRKDRG